MSEIVRLTNLNEGDGDSLLKLLIFKINEEYRMQWQTNLNEGDVYV